MNPLMELRKRGQLIWLDYIRRDLIRNDELKQLIENDGLRGVTSNPSIFEKAIDDSTQYDEAVHILSARNPNIEAREIYDALSIEDVRNAADTLQFISASERSFMVMSSQCCDGAELASRGHSGEYEYEESSLP